MGLSFVVHTSIRFCLSATQSPQLHLISVDYFTSEPIFWRGGVGGLYTEAPCNPEILGSLILPLWGKCEQNLFSKPSLNLFWTMDLHLQFLSGMFQTLAQHSHVHRVDKTSPLLESSEHWSSTYMFTRWTKPVPFWNVLNTGPALTCSQGGQNQSPSGMFWTLVQHLHVHRVDKTSPLLEWPWVGGEDKPCGSHYHNCRTATSETQNGAN